MSISPGLSANMRAKAITSADTRAALFPDRAFSVALIGT
jgi:hypothetical protein